MTPRRILLFLLLIALAACAALGMLALVVGSGDSLWRLVGTTFTTAVGTGLLLPLSFLVDRPRVRWGGLTAMAVVILCWLLMLVIIWSTALPSGGDTVGWKAFAAFGWTLLVGVPLTGALLIISFRWAKVAVFAYLAVAGFAYFFYLLGTMMPEGTGFVPISDFAGKLWMTGWGIETIGGLACLLLVNLGCGDRRYFRWAGIVCCLVGFTIAMLGIWQERSENDFLARIAALVLIAAVAMAHINLILMARLKASQQWLQWGTMGFSLAAGTSAAIAVLFTDPSRIEDSFLLRIAAAGTIASGCGSLALVILSLFNRKPEHAAQVVTEYKEILLACPSCATRQRVNLGDSACRTCGLQFFVKVTEPRCAACGYLLYRLQSDRCPECGAPVGTQPAVEVPALPAAPAENPAITPT